jgi:methyl-accepting chemotaxis protein
MANPVIAAVMKGETTGRAYVVNAWYLTVYKPIKDQGGKRSSAWL